MVFINPLIIRQFLKNGIQNVNNVIGIYTKNADTLKNIKNIRKNAEVLKNIKNILKNAEVLKKHPKKQYKHRKPYTKKHGRH